MYIYQHLQQLNALDNEAAVAAFMKCFGSERWAAAMATARPFKLVEEVFECAETAWALLPAGEWLEAFELEDSYTAKTETDGNRRQIAELYKQRFGFPLMSYSNGRSADELLVDWKARLDNSTQTEMRSAVNELRKIALQKLNKLLEQELAPNANNTARN
jgi:2-oxo-4-hydroxy-4-carboxy--5-ureidoimidazoline (OHCU) decarboxylase